MFHLNLLRLFANDIDVESIIYESACERTAYLESWRLERHGIESLRS